MAMPSNLQARGAVQTFPANITGTDKGSFRPTPSNLDAAEKAFLEKYQPLSDAALKAIKPGNDVSFSGAGFCYSDFPCLSVTKAAAASIGNKEEIEHDQASALLDQLTASPEVTFGQVENSVFKGLRVTHQGAVLDIIAAPGTIKSDVLGGMVFDMYKLQSDDVTTNSIRATPAKIDNSPGSPVALCLYPEGAEANEAYNFCVGKDLNGAPVTKRGISDFLCSIVDVPLVCD